MRKESFDYKVLELVKKIPEGRVATYGGIAGALDTKAYRAVGQALKRNKNPVRVPCHRVICSDGKIGGYCGKGIKNVRMKYSLLMKEGIEIEQGRVDLKKFIHRF